MLQKIIKKMPEKLIYYGAKALTIIIFISPRSHQLPLKNGY